MSADLNVIPLSLHGLQLIKRTAVGDDRGSLQRLYCAETLAAAAVLTKPIAQINFTTTRHAGTVRGMHFQRAPFAETKVVTCLRGRVFDVAVDLRRGSPTFLRWHCEILSPETMNAVLIPEGFAHGFQALTDNCDLLYLHTASYQAQHEGGVHAHDPALSIAWPLPVRGLSRRDSTYPPLAADFGGLAP